MDVIALAALNKANEVNGKVDSLGNVLTFKGTKTSTSALPTSGNTKGDVWLVTEDNSEWVWIKDTATGSVSDWEDLGTASSQVVANPTLAGTEANLTGLEVDGTKYKVPLFSAQFSGGSRIDFPNDAAYRFFDTGGGVYLNSVGTKELVYGSTNSDPSAFHAGYYVNLGSGGSKFFYYKVITNGNQRYIEIYDTLDGNITNLGHIPYLSPYINGGSIGNVPRILVKGTDSNIFWEKPETSFSFPECVSFYDVYPLMATFSDLATSVVTAMAASGQIASGKKTIPFEDANAEAKRFFDAIGSIGVKKVCFSTSIMGNYLQATSATVSASSDVYYLLLSGQTYFSNPVASISYSIEIENNVGTLYMTAVPGGTVVDYDT